MTPCHPPSPLSATSSSPSPSSSLSLSSSSSSSTLSENSPPSQSSPHAAVDRAQIKPDPAQPPQRPTTRPHSDTHSFGYQLAIEHMIAGFRDAIQLPTAVNYFVRSKQLRKLFSKCFVLNGCIFLGSVLLLNHLVPLLFFGGSVATVSQSSVLPNAPNVDNNDSQPINTATVNLFLILYNSVKNLLWIYPLYLISFILSSAWYGDIAMKAFNMTYRKSRRMRSSSTSSAQPATGIAQQEYVATNFRRQLVAGITDEVYRQLLLLFFMIQISLSGLLPVFGSHVAFVLTSWQYAFYAFEYVWTQKDSFGLLKRLEYFERHWAYMLGFGAPNALLSWFFPFFINAGMWAMVFPVFIVLAMRSVPPSVDRNIKPISLFYFSRKAIAWLSAKIAPYLKSTVLSQQEM